MWRRFRSFRPRQAESRSGPVRRESSMLKDELQELVDNPTETLDAEYKEWLDLKNDIGTKAALARHIAALANYGGGTIVLGFSDTMQFAGPNPFRNMSYDRDLIASIVKKYLELPLQCDVYMVKSGSGQEHPVILVPPHGAVPICAKAEGPTVDGKTTGISKGVYYTRKPGPESAPVTSAVDWSPIIRRCVMHERSAILALIDSALRGRSLPPSSIERLKTWHDAAHTAYLAALKERKAPPEAAKWHFQFSYLIDAEGQELDRNQLSTTLQQVNAEVRDLVHTGWSMFYVFTRPGIAPSFQIDPPSGGGDDDFLECFALSETGLFDSTDMWRVSADGMATLIRAYWEDASLASVHTGLDRGSWLSPNILVRSLAEFVRHARGLAERFDAPSAVSFRCEWYGLRGRRVFDPSGIWGGERAVDSDRRIGYGTWPLSALLNDWPAIVCALGAQVARLFEISHVLTPAWVQGQAPTWRR
jgi:hypothetical protein